MLLLLDSDHMSLHHLNQVRNWMKEEEAQKVKAGADLKKTAARETAEHNRRFALVEART